MRSLLDACRDANGDKAFYTRVESALGWLCGEWRALCTGPFGGTLLLVGAERGDDGVVIEIALGLGNRASETSRADGLKRVLLLKTDLYAAIEL